MIDQTIGHFRIRDRLGAGGMGEVFLADDTALRRKVALKFVAGASADEAAGRRLRDEAYAVAALDHPFICKVFETGEHDGRPFIAMEYVQGETLKDRLAAGPVPAAEVVRIAGEIAEALDFAHTHGIVHRDLKPANVMLQESGHVKLMDFGIARRIMPEGTDWITRSAAGETLGTAGTLAYMSPEQIRGQAVDARTDVFSFGILLQEILTGVHPFLRDSAFATADAIAHEAPAPLDAGAVPPVLAHVIGRCLEKDRDLRFGSFRDVRAALARPEPPAARRPLGRRRALALGVVSIAVLALLAWRFDWFPFSGQALAFAERDWIVIADFENLAGDPVFDRSLNAAVEVAIAQSTYVNVFPRDRLQAALQRMRRPRDSALDASLASEIAQREGARAVLVCSIAQLGQVYSLTASVIDPRTQAVVIRESADASGRDHVLDALNELAAAVRRRLGESIDQLSAQATPLPVATTASLDALKLYADSGTVSSMEAADELLRQAIAIDSEFAMALASLGYRYFLSSDRKNRTEGDRLINQALSLTERLTVRERLWIQAAADDARGNRQQAAAAYEAYLAQYPDDTRALFRLGWTYMATLEKPEAAIKVYTRLTEIDPRDSGGWINLATCYNSLRRYQEAADTYEKAFALAPASRLGEYVNNEYGAALVHLGRVDEARRVFDEMTTSPDAMKQARGHRSTAFLLMYLGQYHKAIAELDQGIEINDGGGLGLSAFRDVIIRAGAYLALGKTAEASRDLTAATSRLASLSVGPEWLSGLVKLRARQGQLGEAERLTKMIARAVGNALTDSSVSRNLEQDQGHLDLATAELELARGRPEEAVARAQAARVRLLPVSVLESLAKALEAAGRLEDAVRRHEELLDLDPYGFEEQQDAMDAHLALGALYERLGRTDEATALYRRLAARLKDADEDLVVLREIRARLGSR